MLFKKVIHITVSLLLMVSTTGVVINKHYSGEELFSASFYIDAESCCETSCCHHEHQSNCHEESDFYKLSAEFTKPSTDDIKLDYSNLTFDVTGFSISVSPLQDRGKNILKLPLTKGPPSIGGLPVLYHSLLL